MRHLLSLAFILLSSPAFAGLTFCNDTGSKIELAIGYKADGNWTSEGWWHIDPDACKTVEGGDLTKRYYYYHARGDGMTWEREAYYFCTGKSPFTITGDTDCETRGLDRAAFNEIQLSKGVTDLTLTLTTPKPQQDAPKAAPPATPETTLSGLLSHRDVTDAGIQCELHSDWTRVISYVSQTEDTRQHEHLMTLPPNTPMVWTGTIDVADAGYAEMRLLSAKASGADPMAEARFGIQGSWISHDDSNYMVLINGGVFEEWYGGTPTETSMFDIVADCPGAHGFGTYLEVRSFGSAIDDDAPRCFDIVHYDDHSLELFPLGTMNMLTFSANGM